MRSTVAIFFCILVISSFSLAAAAAGGAAGLAELQAVSLNNTFNYRDFVRGIFLGIGVEEGWKDLTPCLKANQDAYESINLAIQYFKNKNETMDIIMGLSAIGKALTDLPTSVQGCGASVKDIKKLYRSLYLLNSTKAIGWRIAKNLVFSSLDFYSLISNVVFEYKAENWEDFGINIGKIIDELILVEIHINKVTSSAMPDPEIEYLNLPKFAVLYGKFNTTSLKIFVKGFVRGLGATANWTELAPCFNANKDMIASLNFALLFFRKGDPMDILNGVAAIGQVLVDLPTAINSCARTGKDFAKVAKSLAAINGTRGFVSRVFKNTIINSLDIYLSMTNAIAAYEAENWEEFGAKVGEMLDEVILADIPLDQEKKTLEENFLATDETKMPQEFLAY
eukprot:CAMPEP_0176420220 /NCGR_PEP_ID=MMETSP0127-20121128/8486_1 /TAXON_ID=938130 /ORGANISM="Platyophrya macrostoma, Strain WH" /LENGTH=394 /DNA_ID=CAMNT_0017800793 /DNA_START=13 /DNA_END=1197 /DNA_ORIENTATION=-